MKNKQQVINHQRELNKRAGYHESSRQTAMRLLYTLQRANPLYDNDGNVKDIVSLRAYFLKHDRKEYRKLLYAIRLNLGSAGRCSGKVNANQFRYIDEFKEDQYAKMKLTQDLRWGMKVN